MIPTIDNSPIGWIGLGKLGLPCALALATHTSNPVLGYDPNPDLAPILARSKPYPHREDSIERYLAFGGIDLRRSISDVIEQAAELVFVAVPTPHAAEYGGERPMPTELSNFDYTTLRDVASQVSDACEELDRDITLVIVSTVLPGTMWREIMPMLSPRVKLLYNPFFIAMGTTVHDFLYPEFVLIGTRNSDDAKPLVNVYQQIHSSPIRLMSYESAELTKVAYNTFISQKITFANTLLEICDATGADVDAVTGALQIGHDRITSSAYLTAGMGDGGACHPRDNIAMAWLAANLNLSVNPFSYVTRAREAQSRWLARKVASWADGYGMPVVLLGKTYKPNTDLTAGSPALLLSHYLRQDGIDHDHWDPHIDSDPPPHHTAIYIITTRHNLFAEWQYPKDSVVIDPFRYIDNQPGVRVVRLGEGTQL